MSHHLTERRTHRFITGSGENVSRTHRFITGCGENVSKTPRFITGYLPTAFMVSLS